MWMQSKLGPANCRCTSIKILVSKGVCKRLTPVTAKPLCQHLPAIEERCKLAFNSLVCYRAYIVPL